MDLPRGARLKHGGLGDLSRFCEELSREFKGSAVFFIKSPKRFYEAALLLSSGKIIAASLKDVDGGTELSKEEALLDVARKIAESSGDLDISSFSDFDLGISLERNLYAVLDSPVELSALIDSIRGEVAKKADEAEGLRRAEEEARAKAESEKKRIEEERVRREEEKRLWEAEKRRLEEERLRREEEARRRREEEERKKRLEEERARKEAEERRRREEEERQRRLEEERKRKAAEEARRAAEEQARRFEEERKAKEEEERRRREEEEARRRAEEEEKKRKAEEERLRKEEEERRRKEEEERKRKAAEEARRAAEEQARRLEEERKAKAEEERRRREEEERRRREEEEARRRAEEEEKKRKAEEEKRKKEEAKKKAEEEKRKAEEERARKEAEKKAEEARKAEEVRKRKAEEEEKRRVAEEEKKRKAEEERLRKEEEVRKRKAAEEARIKAEIEEEIRAKAEEAEKNRRLEEERQKKAEEDKAQVKRAVEVVKASEKLASGGKSGPEAEARNRGRQKIAEWKNRGYVTDSLERTLESDISSFNTALKKFEFDVSVLQRIEKQLDSLDTKGFEERAKALRFKLRDTQRLVDLMNEVTQLEKDINAGKGGKAPLGAESASEVPKAAAAEKKAEKKEDPKPAESAKGVSKKDSFANLLRNLELSVKDIKGVAVTTKNGLPIAVRLPRELDVEAFCGMSAAMYGAAETTMMELKRSSLLWVYTETDDSTLIVVDAGPSALLVALIGVGANIGLVLVKLKYAADTVRTLMK